MVRWVQVGFYIKYLVKGVTNELQQQTLALDVTQHIEYFLQFLWAK